MSLFVFLGPSATNATADMLEIFWQGQLREGDVFENTLQKKRVIYSGSPRR